MTRVEFLTELDRRLSSLSKEQADEYLAYYAEMLTDRMEDGMSEEEAVASMERVEVIARRILGTVYTTPEKKNSGGNWFTITALAVGAVAAVALVAISALTGLSGSLGGIVRADTVVVEEQVALPDINYVDEHDVFVETYGIHVLDVSWVSGCVTFEIWDEDEIGIFEYGAENMRYNSVGGTLKIEHKNNDAGDLTVCLPRAFAENYLEEIRIHVNSADVTLHDVNAATLIATTVSGWLDISGCFHTANIKTTSGGVSLDGSMEDVVIDSVSGEVFFSCDSMLRSLRAESISGMISINIPDELGFDLTFSGVNSVLSSGSFDLFAENELRMTHGDAQANLNLHSTSGDVFLEVN